MNIIADENLAFVDYFFADIGKVEQHSGRTLKNHDLTEAEVLLVRSVTKVDASLLDKTSIKFVGSATIGTDHLDTHYLNDQNIQWANAAGCNAQAVAEYVVTALLTLRPKILDSGQQFCLGIVGLGNVGQRLATLATRLGWRVVATDPYVSQNQFVQIGFDELLQQADAISVHVPLTFAQPYATHHLFNAHTFSQLPPHTILVNSARGSVIEEQALLADIKKTGRQVVLDVFEHEPIITEQLLDAVTLVTPHIAGYSVEGKARGTQMIYESVCAHFALNADKQFETQLEACPQIFDQQNFKAILKEKLCDLYDIQRDNRALRECLNEGRVDQKSFDHLRKTYPLRREWSAYGA